MGSLVSDDNRSVCLMTTIPSMQPAQRALATVKRVGTGLSIILFPIMLLVGFATHPNIFSFEIVTDVETWIAEWRGNFMFHAGHLLVMLAVPFIIVACLHLMSLLKNAGAWLGLMGATLGIFGAFMLAVDKGALTFVLTAFNDISDAEFEKISPALEAIFNREGWLWITWGFVALPMGFTVLAIGLIKEKIIPKWQGVCMIAGLLLLINPDIEIVSSAGALLLCAAFIPIGLRVIKGHSNSISRAK